MITASAFQIIGLIGIFLGLLTHTRDNGYVVSWIIMCTGMILFQIEKDK